ncbi:hypothetical protein [Mycobacterium sp. URHB0021]
MAVAADVTGGYPYFLQAVGEPLWDNAISSPIGADDVGGCMLIAARSAVAKDGLPFTNDRVATKPEVIAVGGRARKL